MTADALRMESAGVTWFTLRCWNELEFAYADVVGHVLGDQRLSVLAQHEPPLLVVVNVRYGNEPARYP